MPYISKEETKLKRNLIKKAFPDFKFSIVNNHSSVLSVTILSGPVEMITYEFDSRYESVNHFYINDHYKDHPEVSDILIKIYTIMRAGNYIESEDGDYGSIPSFYTHLNIGRWDKPYTVISKK